MIAETTPRAGDTLDAAIQEIIRLFPWINPQTDVKERRLAETLWYVEIALAPGPEKQFGMTVVSRTTIRFRFLDMTLTVAAADALHAVGAVVMALRAADWANDPTKGFLEFKCRDDMTVELKFKSDRRIQISPGERVVLSPTRNAFHANKTWFLGLTDRAKVDALFGGSLVPTGKGWSVAEAWALGGEEFPPP